MHSPPTGQDLTLRSDTLPTLTPLARRRPRPGAAPTAPGPPMSAGSMRRRRIRVKHRPQAGCATLSGAWQTGMAGITVNDPTQCFSGFPGMHQEQWNAGLSAPSYAVFAALLFGFAIAGLFWIASSERSATDSSSSLYARRRTGERPSRSSTGDDIRAVSAIWMCLLPLVLATLFYAETPGELRCVASFYDTFIAAILLTMGTVLLFVGVGRLLNRAFNRRFDRAESAMSWAVVTLGTLLVFDGNDTILTVISVHLSTGAIVMNAVALIVALVIAPWATRASRRHRERNKRSGHESRLPTSTAVALFASVATTVIFYVSPFWRETPGWLLGVMWARLVIWCVFVLCISELLPEAPLYPREGWFAWLAGYTGSGRPSRNWKTTRAVQSFYRKHFGRRVTE